MNTLNFKLATYLFAFLLVVPHVTSAYFTTNQTATKVTDDIALFTVTYSFGHSERDFYMPITIARDLPAEAPAFAAGVSLINGERVTTDGTITGIILTKDPDVSIRDGKYFVPAGHKGTFTLLAIVKLSETELASRPNLSLLVTHLPFIMDVDKKSFPNHLNPSELKYYHTPAVAF